MVCFSSPQSTHKDSILHYKAVKVTIDVSDFVEAILDIVVRHHSLPGSIVTDSGSLFCDLETCHCCATSTAFICEPKPYQKAEEQPAEHIL